MVEHLGQLDFLHARENVILLGPPGIGKTHLAIGLAVRACHAGYSVLFDTASNWITRLAAAHQSGHLEAELKKIRRYKLIIIDEVGYIPFDTEAANLFFQLVSSRYERASLIVTSANAVARINTGRTDASLKTASTSLVADQRWLKAHPETARRLALDAGSTHILAEINLEKILALLESLAPIVVLIDESDAMACPPDDRIAGMAALVCGAVAFAVTTQIGNLKVSATAEFQPVLDKSEKA